MAKNYNDPGVDNGPHRDVSPEVNGWDSNSGELQVSGDDNNPEVGMNPLNAPVKLHTGKFPVNGWQTVVGDVYPEGDE